MKKVAFQDDEYTKKHDFSDVGDALVLFMKRFHGVKDILNHE